MRINKLFIGLLCPLILFSACGTMGNMNNTTKGGLIGGGSGALLGATIGGLVGHGKGAAIGAAVGTVVGTGTGDLYCKWASNCTCNFQIRYLVRNRKSRFK